MVALSIQNPRQLADFGSLELVPTRTDLVMRRRPVRNRPPRRARHAAASVRKSDRPVGRPFVAEGLVDTPTHEPSAWARVGQYCRLGTSLRSGAPYPTGRNYPGISAHVSQSNSQPARGPCREHPTPSCVAVCLHHITGGPIPMGRSEEYRRFAAECLEMAGTFDNPQARAVLLQMAQVWFRLAGEVPVSGDAPESETCSD